MLDNVTFTLRMCVNKIAEFKNRTNSKANT